MSFKFLKGEVYPELVRVRTKPFFLAVLFWVLIVGGVYFSFPAFIGLFSEDMAKIDAHSYVSWQCLTADDFPADAR